MPPFDTIPKFNPKQGSFNSWLRQIRGPLRYGNQADDGTVIPVPPEVMIEIIEGRLEGEAQLFVNTSARIQELLDKNDYSENDLTTLKKILSDRFPGQAVQITDDETPAQKLEKLCQKKDDAHAQYFSMACEVLHAHHLTDQVYDLDTPNRILMTQVVKGYIDGIHNSSIRTRASAQDVYESATLALAYETVKKVSKTLDNEKKVKEREGELKDLNLMKRLKSGEKGPDIDAFLAEFRRSNAPPAPNFRPEAPQYRPSPYPVQPHAQPSASTSY